MKKDNTLIIDKQEVQIDGEKNLLELVRKAGIDLPTFCYHSELSVYGACRLCMVDVVGKGLLPACSTPPEPGMVLKTATPEIRGMRKMIVELLLAGHEHGCPTCYKNSTCRLQALAKKLGIEKIRFKQRKKPYPPDISSAALARDPNKCILCGDCVRMCDEIQGVGAIDFAYRGSKSMVMPCFGKGIGQVECVNCGQCARVCPTGAITPKPETEAAWKALDNPDLYVIAQIAPAVRVAIGEAFGLDPGSEQTGRITAALRRLGFYRVFDTSFTADLTVIEEAHEFLKRVASGKHLPQFTSCCPAWVKFAEQYYPELLPHLSSCRSPQQMFGALSKEILSATLGVEKDKIVVVSIMPCTAKKYEASKPEFSNNGIRDVDVVLTTQELARMIDEAGLNFRELAPEPFDLPFGFKSGAGIIFGNSGGVSEAVLRFAAEKLSGKPLENHLVPEARGDASIKELNLSINGKQIRIAIVSGLGNAKKVIEQVHSGASHYDLIEVMACSGGCVGGAGQPVYHDPAVRKKRTEALYSHEAGLQVHKSQDNPFIKELYTDYLNEPGGQTAHRLLHTGYKFRKRTHDEGIPVITSDKPADHRMDISVCFGTSCFLRGSQKLMRSLLDYLKKNGLTETVDVKASFCFEQCDRGPTVNINGRVVEKCTLETLRQEIESSLPR